MAKKARSFVTGGTTHREKGKKKIVAGGVKGGRHKYSYV